MIISFQNSVILITMDLLSEHETIVPSFSSQIERIPPICLLMT